MKTTDRPTWTCEKCGKPLAGNDGAIAVSYDDLHRYSEAHAAWKAKHPSGSILTLPDPTLPEQVSWHVLHDRCGVGKIVNPYLIEGDRIDTWQKVASWSAHLLEKEWFPDTRWPALLRRAGVGEA